jgi:flagellar protein FliS
MGYEKTANAYRENAILGTSREQLVPLLYQHLLVNLRKAYKHISAKEIEEKAQAVDKASAILYELMGSLDFDANQELASRLASLYTYFIKELTEASRSLNPQRLAPVIEMVASLHESWLEAARIVSQQQEESGVGEARSTA